MDMFYEFKDSDVGAPYACVSHINPIQYEPFRGCSRMGEGGDKKVPSLSKICLIYYIDETWHSYTLPKENPKNT